MRYIFGIVLLSSITIISGCARRTNNEPPKLAISHEEALAFETKLLNDYGQLPQEEQNAYIQPSNKSVPCKLPINKKMAAAPNLKAYWDGQCKNGFAYGLGRDINISDTHHIEEVTVHDGTGFYHDAPAVSYDYVNNKVVYGTITDDRVNGEPYVIFVMEEFININNASGFDVKYTSGETYPLSKRHKGFAWSLFSPINIALNGNNKIIYRIVNESAVPDNSYTARSFFIDTLDATTNMSGEGAIRIVDFKNGQSQYLRIKNGQPEEVMLPDSYVSYMRGKYFEVLNLQTSIDNAVKRAKYMEDGYRDMACNGKHRIAGLDEKISSKYCTWREQFKEPYQQKLAMIKQNNEQMQLAEQQRQIQIQQQATYEQQAAYERQVREAEALNSLADTTLEMGSRARQSGLNLMNTMQMQQQNKISQQQLQQQKRLNNYILRNR